MKKRQVIVIGAGASGLMAAGSAAQAGAIVTLLEKTRQPGSKVLLTGQTRCNLSHSGSIDDFVRRYGLNGRFLYGAFSQFFRANLLEMLSQYGISTREEPDGRIFPASGKAADIVEALKRYAVENDADLRTCTSVTGIGIDNGHVIKVKTELGFLPADAVIVATGGASYPVTGSEGDGYAIARSAGHSIVKIHPGLVPLAIRELEICRAMQGSAPGDARLTAYSCLPAEINPQNTPARDIDRNTRDRGYKNVLESRRGEFLFTHFGISGPVVLDMSGGIAAALEAGPVSVSIDMVPDLNSQELSGRLRQEFASHGSQACKTVMGKLLPSKMLVPFLNISGIPEEKRCSQATADERTSIVNNLKCLRLTVKETLSIRTAMVTSGGISLKEIDPRTMASLVVKGLYFCGEVIDIAGDSGGYNLQAAFSTGYVAGQHAAKQQ